MAEMTMITVNINGKLQQVASASSLAMALQQCADYQQWAAVAINQQFIPKTSYASTILSQGDCIDILVPMQGG